MGTLAKINYLLKISVSNLHIFFIVTSTLIGILVEALSIGIIFPFIKFILDPTFLEHSFFKKDYLSWIHEYEKNTLIILFSFILIGIFYLKSLIIIFINMINARFASSVQSSISQQLIRKYIFDSYEIFLKKRSNKMISELINETIFLGPTLLQYIILISEIVTVIGISFMIFLIDFRVSLIIFSMLILIFLLWNMFLKSKVRVWGEQRKFFYERKINDIQHIFSGFKTIKINSSENYFLKQFKENNIGYSKIYFFETFTQGIPRIVIELLFITFFISIIIFFSSNNLDVVNLVPILGLVGATAVRVMPSFNKIVYAYQQLNYRINTIHALYEELKNITNIQADKKNDNYNNSDFIFNDEIKIDDLDFKYKDSDLTVFKNLKVNFKKNEITGIIGESGIGKTTLINLLLGLLEPEKGQITFDNLNIHKALKNWQKNISFVEQDLFLLNDTIRNNICFGQQEKEINDNDIFNYLNKANLGKFVKSLKEGLNTFIVENGRNLSGGQKQRICLARALYKKSKILLLDEPTSALDEENKKYFFEFLNKIKKEITVIIISHDISSLRNVCDKIYEIEDKKIKLVNEKNK